MRAEVLVVALLTFPLTVDNQGAIIVRRDDLKQVL